MSRSILFNDIIAALELGLKGLGGVKYSPEATIGYSLNCNPLI